MKRTLLSTTLGPEKIRLFGIKAAEQGRTKAALLRVMVDAYLDREAGVKKKGGNFRQGGRI